MAIMALVMLAAIGLAWLLEKKMSNVRGVRTVTKRVKKFFFFHFWVMMIQEASMFLFFTSLYEIVSGHSTSLFSFVISWLFVTFFLQLTFLIPIHYFKCRSRMPDLN